MKKQNESGWEKIPGQQPSLLKKLEQLKQTRYGIPLLCAAAVAVVAAVVLLVVALLPGGEPASSMAGSAASGQAGSQSYENVQADSDYESTDLDTDAFSGTILPETEDAGQDYVKNTLFIGDSNTVRYMSYGFASLENAIGVIGMGASDARTLPSVKFKTYADLITIPKAVTILQPQRIIIGFGTNNLGKNPDNFIKEYTKTIKAIYDAYPYCDIIVNAIPPVDRYRDYPNVTMQMVDKFNEALVEMCQENGWKFLNSTEVLKDEKTGFCKTQYTISDGLHLSKEGVTALFNYIRTHAYETEDIRPKPLKSVPKRGETPPDLIVKDPLKTDGPQRIAVTFAAGEGGTISGEAEQSVKLGTASSTVVAVPNEGFEFVGWDCAYSGVSDLYSPSITYTVAKDCTAFGGITLTAVFKPIGHTVRFTLSSLEGGHFGADATSQSVSLAVENGKTAAAILWVNEGYAPLEDSQNGLYALFRNGDGSYTVSVNNVTADLELTVKLQKLATATPTPSPTPSASPDLTPTPSPTPDAGAATATPSPTPDGAASTPVGTAEPTAVPTAEPTAVPTAEPTAVPTAVPADPPADQPAADPPPADQPAADPPADAPADPGAGAAEGEAPSAEG